MTVPKVFKPRGSGLRNERSSRGYLWKPLKGTVVNAQDDPSWVLLANYAEIRTSLRQDLRQVSEVKNLASPQSGRTLRGLKIWLVHKVDRPYEG